MEKAKPVISYPLSPKETNIMEKNIIQKTRM